MNKKNIGFLAILFAALTQLCSCKKYLEPKADKTTFIPNTLKDLQALLDADRIINQVWPELPELAADNFYFTDSDWSSLFFLEDRKNYTWDADATYNEKWLLCYRTIVWANTVLDNIIKIERTELNKGEWNDIKGQALFFRGYAFYHVAELWCKPFNSLTAGTDIGIPLRLSSDINEATTRSSVAKTYEQILRDLKEAVSLLPVTSAFPTRPNKPAVYGALARVNLAMRDYANAGLYADSCLQMRSGLIDYNALNPSLPGPIATFNQEVIFHNTTFGSAIVQSGRIDSNLYNSYSANDLRKEIFFRNNNDGTFGFKGSYDGTYSFISLSCFNGIATDEMYLTRAECSARAGFIDSALLDLNRLLKMRFSPPFTPITATDANDALLKVLEERRKELLFRALRWSDLRRLNLEGADITLHRRLYGAEYSLAPGDPRWVILIPQKVIDFTGIPQNPR